MVNEEKDALLASLNAQREHLFSALEGLSEDDRRRPVLPSAWTPLGLVRHVALEVEQFWFRGAVAGGQATALRRSERHRWSMGAFPLEVSGGPGPGAADLAVTARAREPREPDSGSTGTASTTTRAPGARP